MTSITPLFSVPVFIDQFSIHPTEKEFCSNLPTRHDDPTNIDITTDTRILNLPELKQLKSSAQKAMNVYTRDILHIPDRVEITTSWYTKVTDDSKVLNHYHSYSLFTGVIVFDASPGSRLTLSIDESPTVPKLFDFDYTEFNIFNSKSWWLDMEPNHIYIFPSNICHSAELINKETLVNLIAFDTFVNGTVGRDEYAIHITAT